MVFVRRSLPEGWAWWPRSAGFCNLGAKQNPQVDKSGVPEVLLLDLRNDSNNVHILLISGYKTHAPWA